MNSFLTKNLTIGFKEFVALVASMTALVALSIDAMLPALPSIVNEFELTNPNEAQLVIAFIFIGMAIGPLWFGPLSDSIGRKKTIFIGFVIFILGTVISLNSDDFSYMLLGRIIQGLGVSGPRIVAMAMVRDCFKGNDMARVMSFVTAVFILVPALAPSLGQLVIQVSGWRNIFSLFIVITLIISVWLGLRQGETLSSENKREFSIKELGAAFKQVLAIKKTIWITAVIGVIFGSFMGYLNSSQQLFQDIYGVGEDFPLYFAVLALGFGGSSLLNAKLVMRFGMQALALLATSGLVIVSFLFLFVILFYAGVPPFWMFLGYAMVAFMLVAIAFGNFNAMAMEPLGHVAGLGAALISTISTVIALPVGILVGQLFNFTLYPVTLGFLICSLVALIVVLRTR